MRSGTTRSSGAQTGQRPWLTERSLLGTPPHRFASAPIHSMRLIGGSFDDGLLRVGHAARDWDKIIAKRTKRIAHRRHATR